MEGSRIVPVVDGSPLVISPDGLLVCHAGPANVDAWCALSANLRDPAGVYRMTVRVRGGLVMALGFQVAGRDLHGPWAAGEAGREIFHPARGQFGGDGVWPRGALGPLAAGERIGFVVHMADRCVELFRDGSPTGQVMKVPGPASRGTRGRQEARPAALVPGMTRSAAVPAQAVRPTRSGGFPDNES